MSISLLFSENPTLNFVDFFGLLFFYFLFHFISVLILYFLPSANCGLFVLFLIPWGLKMDYLRSFFFFLYIVSICYKLPLNTAFAVPHKFRYVSFTLFICLEVFSNFPFDFTFDLLVNQEFFNLHIFVNFPIILPLFIFSFIPLWWKKGTWYDFNNL